MKNQAVNLAIGCILRLASRPFQASDLAQYEQCRGIILDHAGLACHDYAPNYARDRMKGAQGD